ncbi:hypothetical protein ACOAKC_01235 [Hathewaya histolytica]|uniref:hypothetical protein n=1 Tax=Hathewaya histolytica TaxID=1498 RepID=UPI003B67D2B7
MSLKNEVLSLACNIAQDTSERTGKDYEECMSWALDEACRRLNVRAEQFIRLFA